MRAVIEAILAVCNLLRFMNFNINWVHKFEFNR